MVAKQVTRHGKGAIVQRVLSYTLIRQLCVLGIVVAIVLLTAWWRYSSDLSQATSIPAPVGKTSVVSPLAPEVAPITQVQVNNQQTADSTATTQLEVNGQTVPVPVNGTIQKTIQSPDGNTSVNLSIDATSSGSKNTSSSTHIQMNSSSHSQVVTHETH